MDRDDQMILTLLNELDERPDTTQKDLASKLGVAVGLVNSYLKRVIYKGYVKTKQLDRRRLKYLITPTGIREKSRLTYEFLQYSYQYIMMVRRKVKNDLIPLQEQGKHSVIFYGSGEAAELAYMAVRELGMDLVGVVDPVEAGNRFIEHEISDMDWLKNEARADILVVLSTNPRGDVKQNDLKEFASERGMDIIIAE